MSILRVLVLVSALFIAAGADASVQLTQVVSGVASLVGIEHAGDGSGRLFLVSQPGRIFIYDGTSV